MKSKIIKLVGVCSLVCYSIVGQTIKVSTLPEFNPTNATQAFIKALNSPVDTIIIDDRIKSYFVEPLRFKNLRNKTIILEYGVVLCALSGKFTGTSDALMEFRNCEKINLVGQQAVLEMRKEEYATGEWRHVLSIRGSSDFFIDGLILRNGGGDGIYIAGDGVQGSYSENITIRNVKSENNKRQGISIISAQNILVIESEFKNTNGTLPEAGVDLEPNNEKDRLTNIVFQKCSFYNNNHSGVLIALGKLTSRSKDVNIEFNQCKVYSNLKSIDNNKPSEIYISANVDDPVGGTVIFKNTLIHDSQWGFLMSRKRSDAFQVIFEDCAIRDICKNGNSVPIYLEVPHYTEPHSLGGFSFNKVFLQINHDLPIFRIRGSLKGGMKSLKDVSGNFTIKGSYRNTIDYINYTSGMNENVDIQFTFIP